MEIPTRQNHVYTLTCDNACDVYDVDTGTLIHQHHAGEVQSQFTAIGMKSETTDDTAILTELFNGATAGNGSGGGFIESNLRIGHGAADAVAAVCTLTLGEATEEGTLVDNAGHELHLDAAPATFAHDFWAMTHPTAGGVLVVGDHTFAAVAEKADAYASGYFLIDLEAETQLGGTLKLMRGEEVVYSHEFAADEEGEPWTLDSVKAELEADEDWPCTILDDESEIDFQAPVIGESWNDVELVLEGDLFMNGAVYHGGMEYGSTARTLEEALELAVSTINDDEDSPIRAEVGEDALGNKGIDVYALEVGSGHDYDCTQTTGQFFQVSIDWESDGQDARTLDEVAAAITAEGSDFADEVVVTHASGASTLTLTAATAGKAANAIVYTSTGCFGSETVKQGSTTRGKDAVEQTAFKIYLNGEELDVEPAPLPTALTPTTAMRNGGVYTVAAAGTALDFSAVTLPDNATAEIWIECTAATNITWPPAWKWLEGSAPQVACDTATEASHRYRIVVLNEGPALNIVARVAYDYENALTTE